MKKDERRKSNKAKNRVSRPRAHPRRKRPNPAAHNPIVPAKPLDADVDFLLDFLSGGILAVLARGISTGKIDLSKAKLVTEDDQTDIDELKNLWNK